MSLDYLRRAMKPIEYLSRLWRTLEAHPLSSHDVPRAMARAVGLQIRTRLHREVIYPWLEDAKLVVSRGMNGATGSIYAGLAEYPGMAFFLHLLRPGDVFFDLGANVGTYTVLAAKVCGARTLAVEPDPDALQRLARNVEANEIAALVQIVPMALAHYNGEVKFWVGEDTRNRIAGADDKRPTQALPCTKLDDVTDMEPVAIKMDLEGGEENALVGAKQILGSKTLQALSTETVSPRILSMLAAAGFERVYYDPRSRELGRTPHGIPGADPLFVRDLQWCTARVKAAPRRSVYGYAI